MPDPAVRTRFAPAPTGYLHLGGARTALFNWLFARHHGGEFVLRIEDTDAERSRPELIEVIYRVLEWLGLDWDGEPVLQSHRSEEYDEAVRRLLDAGSAYWCECTPEEVKARAEARGGPPGYDGRCRDRGLEPGPGRVARFRVPDEGATSFDDVVRGRVSFEHEALEDFVVQRSSGKPLFLVANAVDDPAMGITHVIRGEDLLNITPKVLLLRRALGITDEPVFAHLPLIVNEARQKLSKRRDDVSVGDYIDRGVVREAMANYLALLGWGPRDEVEVRPLEEIVELFRLEDVSKSGAMFDVKKLTHISGDKIREMDGATFAERCRPWLTGDGSGSLAHPQPPPWPPERFDPKVFEAIAPLVQERVRLLSEVPAYVDFLFLDEAPQDDASWTKVMAKEGSTALAVLEGSLDALASIDWEADAIAEAVFAVGATCGLQRDDGSVNRKRSQAPVRVAALGRSVGPPLWEALEILGRERTLRRLRTARDRLAAELAAAGAGEGET